MGNMDELVKQKTLGTEVSSNATHELMTSEAWLHMSRNPVLQKTIQFTSLHLSQSTRENGPSLDQCNDYFHAIRTAKIAYDLGFDDRVVLLSLLHDFLNQKHAFSENVSYYKGWSLTYFLSSLDLDSIGTNTLEVMNELKKIEDVENLGKKTTRSMKIETVAALFTHRKVTNPKEYEKVITEYGVLPFIVNICEAIDNLQYPKLSETGRPVDLIEDMKNIFEPNIERVSQIRGDKMIDDVVRIFRFYLPLLEASGHNEAIREIKDRAVYLLAPKCYERVANSMDRISSEHSGIVERIFKELSGNVRVAVNRELKGRKLELYSPFLKGVGSTVIKMLSYGQDQPELGRDLTQAVGDTEVSLAISNILSQMRDLIRCRIVLPEDKDYDLGAVFSPAVFSVVRDIYRSRYGGISFNPIDIATGEAVQVYANGKRQAHFKKVEQALNGSASGFSMKSKPNGFEGVNIAVCYDEDHRFELQMVTTKMLLRNEFGDASHAGFKAGISGEQVKKHSASVQEYIRN